jgi:hypothetical protein
MLSRIASIRRLGEDARESVNLINNLQCVVTQHLTKDYLTARIIFQPSNQIRNI